MKCWSVCQWHCELTLQKLTLSQIHLQSTQLRSAQLLAVLTHLHPLQVRQSWGKVVCAVPQRNRQHTSGSPMAWVCEEWWCDSGMLIWLSHASNAT
jgi:hypothetical protein